MVFFLTASWEKIKIGAGTAPVLTKHGWLLVYRGVHQIAKPAEEQHHLIYSAGIMILDREQPEKILYRSPHPVLFPELLEERVGIISNVVFPTGIGEMILAIQTGLMFIMEWRITV